MRKWIAAADVRRGAALTSVRYSNAGAALPAAISTVPTPAPSDVTKARVVSWPRLLGLALGVWSVSYLARQALTWGSADMPFSPLGSFALEGIALAIVSLGAVLGWSLVALAALRDIEHATSAAPARCAVIVPYTVLDQYAGIARTSGRVRNPIPLPAPVRSGYPARPPMRAAASGRDHRAAASGRDHRAAA